MDFYKARATERQSYSAAVHGKLILIFLRNVSPKGQLSNPTSPKWVSAPREHETTEVGETFFVSRVQSSEPITSAAMQKIKSCKSGWPESHKGRAAEHSEEADGFVS